MSDRIVFFVGPCRKLNPATGETFPAFSAASRSGRFLRSAIESARMPSGLTFKFDNIIPRPVFNLVGQERNPTCAELVQELENHWVWRLNSGDVVVGLSAVVGEALEKARMSRAAAQGNSGPVLLKLEHPSWMMRRPIEVREDYIRRMRDCVTVACRPAKSGRRTSFVTASP